VQGTILAGSKHIDLLATIQNLQTTISALNIRISTLESEESRVSCCKSHVIIAIAKVKQTCSSSHPSG
jgi:prefoldin subunit 5